MKESLCMNAECTLSETGACLLNNYPEHCPHWFAESNDGLGGGNDSAISGEPAVQAPQDPARFSARGALGVDEARMLMRNEYCHVVGLLGEPDSGKTACLVSLYLLVARKMLDGYRFADSKSLVALDELSRGTRTWADGMRRRMTDRTPQSDENSVRFLHLKLVREFDNAGLHLLIPDLPGEWSTSLIDKNRTDRWQFLRSADAIWMMVDGTSLADARRHNSLHRTNRAIDRLAALLWPDLPALRLVVSRYDIAKPNQRTLDQIREHGARRNFELEIDHVASFSVDGQTAAGTGIAGLVDGTVAKRSGGDDFWPQTMPVK